jgi:RNA polymerase sigma factor (sigma-70 family)
MTTGDLWPERPGQSLPAARPPAPVSGNLLQMRAEWIGFYDTHYYRVVRFMMHVGASPADAQDAAQEAFTESWKLMCCDTAAWQAIDGKAAWIRTLALRRYARPPGSRRRPLTAIDGAIPDQPASGPDHAELTAQALTVLQALRSLDREARAVMAFSLDGFTTADTADALKITPQRVRDVKKKARVALKRGLAATATADGRQS